MSLLTRAARLIGVRGNFAPTSFVWSRGLALLCEHNGGSAFVREQLGGAESPGVRFDPSAYDNVRDGDLVWVRLTALPQFVEEALPGIRARFALVTGDEDWSIPSDFRRAREILDDDRVVCWFTQNFDGSMARTKILPLPIGIDFHTISHRRKWGHPLATPQEQESELEAIRQTMSANAARPQRVHADFHFNQHAGAMLGETRAHVEAVLRRNPNVDFLPRRLARLELWREKTRYAFVVSPRGGGLDCHRTWESLALDNIVIVKSSPLDALYQGLPVVIVDEWAQITRPNLQRWHAKYAGAFATSEVRQRLTNHYWTARIRKVLAERLGHRPAVTGRGDSARAILPSHVSVPRGVSLASGHSHCASGETEFTAGNLGPGDRYGAVAQRDVPGGLQDLHRNLHPIPRHDRHQEAHIVDGAEYQELPGLQSERGGA